jgi:hypothetical protein
MDGLSAKVKSQWTTLGLKPHLLPQAILQAHIILRAFQTLASTCSFQVSRVSRIIARYLAELEHRRVAPNSLGSKKPGSFLLRVKATSPVLSRLTDSPCPSHHPSTERRAHCMNPDILFGNLPTARRPTSSSYPSA